ncbi:sodium:solute symporter family protein [Thermosediminibacter oceani]|uniref:Na+/solute symporter n=1 Tax=Thermosediminibacter oceani (strain ATCC BAA-1034 / DSM 16646 / JW/IW-1228P) TaxID=555079 RepID=D9RZ19_THEOJ|nr:sodium:solute symporter family protein [Thermosediminibacter oceani]ADL08573.1 Na+/solute symporter [Thermosediminibacter oceani DSM 16646]
MNGPFLSMIFFFIYTILMIYSARSGFYDTYSVEDFFVAGRSLNTFFSTATFLATWFSAASILGLGGYIYIYGLSGVIYSIFPWFSGAILLVLLSRRLRKEYSLFTYPEFFSLRYNSKIMQICVALIMIFSYIFYITMQIKGFGLVMSMLLNIPYTAAIFLVYLYILYTTFGGLFSVVKTDTVNAFIIFASFLAFGTYIILQNGGISNIIHQADLLDAPPIFGSEIKTPPGGLLDIFCKGLQPPAYLLTSFFGWGLGLAANPQYVIRIVSAKDTATAKKMIIFAVFLLSIIYTFIVFGALGLRVLIPTSPPVNNVDEIIPTLLNRISPAYLNGIILVSIIAASVSTANSQLLLIATSFTYDILKNLRKEIREEEMLNLNRITIAVAGTLSLLLSFNPPKSLIEFGGNIWGIFSSSTFIPLYAGVFLKNSTRAAEASFTSGLITYLVFLLLQTLTKITILSNIHPGLLGFTASLAAFWAVEWRSKRAKH